jgi:hypothetical protein
MNIFLGLNIARDLNLAAKIRNKLNKKNISYNLDTFNLNSLNSSHLLNIDYDRISNIKNGHKKIREDLIRVLFNIDNNLEWSTNLKLLKEEILYKNDLLETIDSFEEYDLYCLSIYKRYMINYILIVYLIKKKFPNATILVGGPEIILEDSSKQIFESLGCKTSIGDIDESVYSVITSTGSIFSDMRELTISDVPKYTKEELDYLNYNIQLTGSKGCPNYCYFCSTPKLAKFNSLNREIYADWIKYYQSKNINSIFIADNTLNSKGFDDFLNRLIHNKNKVKLIGSNLTFNNLEEEQITKMKIAGFKSASIGIEGFFMGELINKKMPNFSKILSLIYFFVNNNIKLNLFYIFGMPGQSRQIFNEEFKMLKELNYRFPQVSFELYPFFLAPKSYFHFKHKEYGIKISYLDYPFDEMIYDYSYEYIEDLYNRQNLLYNTLTNIIG